MKRLNQRGSHILAIAIGIVVVGVIAFAGYKVMNNDPAADKKDQAATAPTSIENKDDLQQASDSLNDTNATVNSDLNTDSLNDNLDDLL
jgi:hypothetical protein